MATSQEAGLNHAWNYFAFHANQRITVFNFFIVFSGLILAGLGALLQGEPRLSILGVVLGLLLLLLSIVFWQLDRRVSFMIKHSETALTVAEKALLPPDLHIVDSEPAAFAHAKQTHKLWTYGKSFRIIFVCMGIIGLAASGISAMRFGGIVDWTEQQEANQALPPQLTPATLKPEQLRSSQESGQPSRERVAH